MGMAASQARLLMLTARIHDVEYQAQMIQNAKLQLATQEDEVYRKYNEALDATTLTFQDMQGNRIPANFNNLAGMASVNNNLAGNQSYIFRDSSDRIIVPQDIYDAYVELYGNGTGDPYQFALYMMCNGSVDTDSIADFENEYIEARAQGSSSDPLQILKDSMTAKLNEIGEKSGLTNFAKDVLEGESVENANLDEEDQHLIDEYKELEAQYRNSLYKKGAAEIYSSVSGEDKEDFDQDKFNKYVLYGKLIQEEEGACYLTTMQHYGNQDLENDSQFLQDMLQAGKISIETVGIDTKGQISYDSTSVASDSNLDYTATTTIDKKELAKAEAEYELAMKKIDRQDKQYDMELNKLETERTALTTEYDSVKKVIQDNIERTFGIFS